MQTIGTKIINKTATKDCGIPQITRLVSHRSTSSTEISLPCSAPPAHADASCGHDAGIVPAGHPSFADAHPATDTAGYRVCQHPYQQGAAVADGRLQVAGEKPDALVDATRSLESHSPA